MSSKETLLDEIVLRRASIDDARVEVAAGELAPEAFVALEARELAAIALCEKKLKEVSTVTPRVKVAQRRRKRLLYLAFGAFGVALVLLLILQLSPRQPGNSITGNIAASEGTSVARSLDQAAVDVANGNTTAALAAYQNVLALQPKNVQALTQSGWLDFSAGSASQNLAVVKKGEQLIQKAIEIAPTNPAPHLYYGIVALSTSGNNAEATKQFKIFLALQPSKALLAVAAPWLKLAGVASS
jgi:tetratricopeptide (TPR) repeat protein